MRFANAQAPIRSDDRRLPVERDQEATQEVEVTGQFAGANAREADLAPGASYERSEGGEGQGGDDWLSMLDSALSELETEHLAKMREVATPSADEVQVRRNVRDDYRSNAAEANQTAVIPTAPHQRDLGGAIVSSDRGLTALLRNNLIAARAVHGRRRAAIGVVG